MSSVDYIQIHRRLILHDLDDRLHSCSGMRIDFPSSFVGHVSVVGYRSSIVEYVSVSVLLVLKTKILRNRYSGLQLHDLEFVA